MAAYTISGSQLTVRVDYADVGGSFAGWFLLVVQGDGVPVDGFTDPPAAGPDSYGPLSTPCAYYAIGGSYPVAAEGTGAVSFGNERYRKPFLRLIHARLDRMFGEGHSATWSATIIQGVTPAVIDDNW